MTWTRIEDGYQNGETQILDNGSGLGTSKDSGRWAVMVAGKWVANVDTLAEAKRTAAEVAGRTANEAVAIREAGGGRWDAPTVGCWSEGRASAKSCASLSPVSLAVTTPRR